MNKTGKIKIKKKKSAKKMLLMIAMIFLAPFFIFLIGFNIYSNYIHTKQLSKNSLSKILMYQSFLEEDFQCAEYYLANMVANDNSYIGLCYPSSDLDVWLNLFDLKEKLDTVIKTVNSIDALYILSLKNDSFQASYNDRVTYEEQENVKLYLKTLLKEEGDAAVSGWNVCHISGKNYFVKIMGGGQVYCACVVDAEYASIADSSAGNDSYLVFAKDGQFLSHAEELANMGVKLREDKASYISGMSGNRLVVGSHSDYLNCQVVQIDSYLGIWETEATPFILTIATLVFTLLAISCYHFLKKEFLNPLENMVSTMDEIARGGLDSRMAAESRISEYHKVEETFNHMIGRIRELKILAYDRFIQVQQTQLQYYQIQIRPHFFLNCMKNLYAMTAARKYAQMQEMILIMSDYLRSVFQDHSKTVPLCKEIDSVSSYVKLQQMSSPTPPVYTADIEEGLEEFQIPPMSILTFVENSFRYSKSAGQLFAIHVKVKRFLNGEDEFINLTILDNGSGFEQETLAILNDKSKRLPKEHIGIYNVRQRFELIYGKSCSFMFSNMNGACVDIFIPSKKPEAEMAAGEESYE